MAAGMEVPGREVLTRCKWGFRDSRRVRRAACRVVWESLPPLRSLCIPLRPCGPDDRPGHLSAAGSTLGRFAGGMGLGPVNRLGEGLLQPPSRIRHMGWHGRRHRLPYASSGPGGPSTRRGEGAASAPPSACNRKASGRSHHRTGIPSHRLLSARSHGCSRDWW